MTSVRPLRLVVLALALLVAGCAGERAYREGLDLIDAGDAEAGLAKIDEAAKLEPGNREYRQQYFRQREISLQRTQSLADAARAQGEWQAAEGLYMRMLAIDPANARARGGMELVRTDRRHRQILAEAEDLFRKGETDRARGRVREVLAENSNQRDAQALLRRIEERAMRASAAGTALSAALRRPVSLEFRDVNIRQVLDLLSKSSGLNFIFDREVRQDARVTLSVKNTSIDEVLRFVLVTNQLDRKVLNESTLLVYPATQAKLREYQDLVYRTFYLSNADVKQTANMIRALVKTKDMYIDEKLNMLVMRDTPDAVRAAERLIANQDLADPEVVLEVEVLEVASSTLNELGIRYPDQVSYSLVGAAGTAGTLTLQEWLNRNSGIVRLAFTNPFLALNFRNTVGRSNILANPRIRVRNKDKAKIHVGDKVPVITSTATATGLLSQSVTYLDVGLKLDVEPTIHIEEEVGMKVTLEVSNIVREIPGPGGSLTYQLGTRNAATSLRLKDGETQMLAGLINDEDRKSSNQIPGLGDIPVLGRLFGTRQDTVNKTEIVLLITPRIVRALARPELRFEEFPGGTEAAIGAPPLILQNVPLTPEGARSALEAPAPAAGNAAQAAPTGGNRVTLTAPSAIASGAEFSVAVTAQLQNAIRSGLFDFVFDPSRLRLLRAEASGLLTAGGLQPTFRMSAPEGLGRLNVSFTVPNDVRGSGEIARLVFQALGTSAGAPNIRIEAASITDGGGRVLSADLPPPLVLNLIR